MNPPKITEIKTSTLETIDLEPTLKNLQKLCGGYIQIVPGNYWMTVGDEKTEHEYVMLCDEDGKKKGLDINLLATAIYRDYLSTMDHLYAESDHIVGPAILVLKSEMDRDCIHDD